MLIKLRCKSCFAKVSADDDLIGKDVNCPNCNFKFTLPKPQFGFGKILGGYEIEQWLGSGAMGEVYLARQVSMNRPVALKVIKHDISTDREVVDRFTHEAQVLASLNHPYIVPAFDAGHTDDCYYMAMGYVDGETLEDRLKRHGRMDEGEVIDLAFKVADALKYAWTEFKLLHRDIKPANIMLDKMGEIKIMDMGIAKNTTDDGGLTKVGLVVGTPFYMSPEQAQASTGIDFRSDIYALAASMYHLLTGTLPFQGPNVMAILAKKVNFPLVPANEINPDISQETSDMIARLLSYKVDDRLDSFEEFYEMLNKAKKAAQAAKNLKRQNDERTVHMQVPDKVLEHIAKSKSNHRLKKQKVKSESKGKAVIGVLIVLCLFLTVALALVDGKKNNDPASIDEKDKVVETPKDSGGSEKKPITEFGSENDQKTENNEAKYATFQEFIDKNQILNWKASREDAERKKLVENGSASVGYIGEMNLRQGMFTFTNEILSGVKKIQEQNKFTIFTTFRSKDYTQKGCITSLGRSEDQADLTITQDGEQIYLTVRNASKKLDRIQIGKLGKLRTAVFITYDGNVLRAYVNGKETTSRKGFMLKTAKWECDTLTFGSYKNGAHSFWRGDIYSFAIFKDALSREALEDILRKLADGMRKFGRKPLK